MLPTGFRVENIGMVNVHWVVKKERSNWIVKPPEMVMELWNQFHDGESRWILLFLWMTMGFQPRESWWRIVGIRGPLPSQVVTCRHNSTPVGLIVPKVIKVQKTLIHLLAYLNEYPRKKKYIWYDIPRNMIWYEYDMENRSLKKLDFLHSSLDVLYMFSNIFHHWIDWVNQRSGRFAMPLVR